jgi:polysaccharide pyruvyl transferase WcaK-like protein
MHDLAFGVYRRGLSTVRPLVFGAGQVRVVFAKPEHLPVNIVQFGLHYSPNVGDGIIAECLGAELARQRPGADYRTVDLSGRDGFGVTTVRNRELALKMLGVMPAGVRGRLVEARLGRLLDRVGPKWARMLAGADLAILGGGQIFSDADLNFCVKIARAARLIGGAGVPVAVHAAGVSPNWSARGTELFGELFAADLRMVGLRDAASIEAWRRQTGGRGPAPVLSRDPGLLAVDCYGPVVAGDEIGLGVTAPHILRYHADAAVAGAGAQGLEFFSDLARELVRRGHRVRLFCNGAVEDRAALDRVVRQGLGGLVDKGAVSVAPPPDTPGDLVRTVAGCRVVVAHRLHACIVAWSYARPVVGLGWDRKLESFFASIGAGAHFVGAKEVNPGHLAEKVTAALVAGVDARRHAQVLGEARDSIGQLLALAD